MPYYDTKFVIQPCLFPEPSAPDYQRLETLSKVSNTFPGDLIIPSLRNSLVRRVFERVERVVPGWHGFEEKRMARCGESVATNLEIREEA